MRGLRMLVLAVVMALVAAACSSDTLPEPPIATGSPVPDAVVTAPADEPTSDEAPDDAGQEEGGGSADEAADGEGSSGDDGDDGGSDGDGQQPAQLTTLQDGAAVGTNAAAYLRGDRPRVVLEIDIQEGANFPNSVIDHVSSILARESNASVEVQTGAATSTRRDAWTPDQLRAAAAETRTVAHSDQVAVLHLLVLRDGYEQDNVLGLAFGSSSAVVFPDQWSDLTTALIAGDRIARAVTTHEIGHLLGLVGLYEEPTSDHEDPEHPGHTTDSDDVMYYAVERSIISQLDGIPTDFGPNTRADLAAIRDG